MATAIPPETAAAPAPSEAAPGMGVERQRQRERKQHRRRDGQEFRYRSRFIRFHAAPPLKPFLLVLFLHFKEIDFHRSGRYLGLKHGRIDGRVDAPVREFRRVLRAAGDRLVVYDELARELVGPVGYPYLPVYIFLDECQVRARLVVNGAFSCYDPGDGVGYEGFIGVGREDVGEGYRHAVIAYEKIHRLFYRIRGRKRAVKAVFGIQDCNLAARIPYLPVLDPSRFFDTLLRLLNI